MKALKPPSQAPNLTLKQENYLRCVAEDYPGRIGLFRDVFTQRTSRAKAMRAMCLACCYFDRENIAYCVASECPLWLWRPYKENDEKNPIEAEDEIAPDIEIGQ